MKAWCYRGCFPFPTSVDSHVGSVLIKRYGRLHPVFAENLLSKKVEFYRVATCCGGTMARPPSGGALALRWRIVTAFEACGCIKGVAKQLGCSPTTVRKWIARYEAKGDVSGAPRVGRPNKGLSA